MARGELPLGRDAVVFTGGIGENAAAIRARVLEGAAWLGEEADPEANAAGGPRITSPASKVQGWVIQTDEERVIAAQTRRVLGRPGAPNVACQQGVMADHSQR